MGIQFGSGFTVIDHTWTEWKALNTLKGGQHQSNDDGVTYSIRFYDGPEVHVCAIWKGIVPDAIIAGGYSQAQNDSDKSDWETNYLPTTNGKIIPRAADGRQIHVTSVSKTKKNFNLKAFSFKPGQPNSIVNDIIGGTGNRNIVSLSDVTMTCYDMTDAVTTLAALAVKTVFDFEPTYDFEAVGGWLEFPSAIVGGSTNLWWVGAMGVPDIPAGSGGSIPIVSFVDLEAVYQTQIISDGRATQLLKYNATYHTNKYRWVFRHPANGTYKFQVFLEMFTG